MSETNTTETKGLTTKQAFEKLISKRGWHTGLNLPKTTVDSYGHNFRTGKLSLDKMEKVLEVANIKVIQEKLWDF